MHATLKTTLVPGCLALAMLLLPLSPALACSCMRPGAPRAELEKSDAVFLGTVVAVEDAGEGPFPRLRVRFALEAVWKGLPEDDRAVVTTAADGATCGYTFAVGETYVVYAYGGQEGQELTTSLCTRNAPREDAAEDLADLGEPARRPARRDPP